MNTTFNHLVWLGADTATYPAGIFEKCESATLIDARGAACDVLRKNFSGKNVNVLQLTISGSANTTHQFYEYNAASYSSLNRATGLNKIFPSIVVVKQTSITCNPINQVISNLNLRNGKNALIIDIIDQSCDIVNTLHATELLKKFTSIFISTSKIPLYEGSPCTQTVVELLEQLHYEVERELLDDPDLPFLIFTLNTSSALTEKNTVLEHSLKSAENQNQLLKDKISALNKKIVELQGQLSDAYKKLEIANQTQQITKSINSIQNTLSKGVSNAVKQIEDFISLQNYLERGIKPLSFHGWPISPDIALYITSLIDSNDYDLIIEFGSGTSSVIMARALLTKNRNMMAIETTLDDSVAGNLLPRIISFEHNSFYYEKTAAALRSNKVDHLVDLVHAPLVDYEYSDGSKYLYYNCGNKLIEIAERLSGKEANILVLVDGPPGATNKNARLPALPNLLTNLSEHHITIVMDDYKRTEEKETVEMWKAELSSKGFFTNTEEIDCEKGLAVIKVKKIQNHDIDTSKKSHK